MAALTNFIQQLVASIRGGEAVAPWPTVGVLPGCRTKDESRTQFHRLVFSMLGLVAAADGRVARKEHEQFQNYIRKAFRLPKQEELAALHQFYKVSRTKIEFAPLAVEFGQLFHNSPKVLELMLDGLLFIANAENTAGPEALSMIELARAQFGVSEVRVERSKSKVETATAARLAEKGDGTQNRSNERLRRKIRGEDLQDDPYVLLGCQREDSDAAIREHYRKVVFASHPDRIRADGANDKAVEAARNEFTRILKAYKQIRRERELS